MNLPVSKATLAKETAFCEAAVSSPLRGPEAEPYGHVLPHHALPTRTAPTQPPPGLTTDGQLLENSKHRLKNSSCCIDPVNRVYDVIDADTECLLGSYVSPLGSVVEVYDACVNGTCECLYEIEGVRSQLKPCRFAAIVFLSGREWASKYVDLVWAVTDGFPIVDTEVNEYECENYSSITSEPNSLKMDSILKKELAEGMVSQVEIKPICIHALGAVPKSSGGIRHITDCSRPTGVSVNNHCSSVLNEFCFKSVDNVVDMLDNGSYMSVVDIQAAYRAVPIRAAHRKYQGFKWVIDGEERWFVENRLCFGLRLGPSYFNSLSNFVHDILWNVYRLKIVNYLDDFISVSDTLEDSLRARELMVHTLRKLGFHVAFSKLIYPSTCVTYLGIEIDSVEMELRLPDGKIDKLKALLKFHLCKKRIAKKNLEILSGYLSHCSHIIKGGRMFCSNIYDLYRELVKKNLQFISMPIDVQADLKWWDNLCIYFNGSSKIVKDQYYLPMVSDSSLRGFAVYLGHDWAVGTWEDKFYIPLTSDCHHIVFRPVEEVFDKSNINELELWPIVVGLKRWFHLLKNKSLLVFTDNTQVMYMLTNSRSSNSVCKRWLREIFWLCAIYNIELTPLYINTKNNLVADSLSRLPYFKGGNEISNCLGGSDLCCLKPLINIYRDSGSATGGESFQDENELGIGLHVEIEKDAVGQLFKSL